MNPPSSALTSHSCLGVTTPGQPGGVGGEGGGGDGGDLPLDRVEIQREGDGWESGGTVRSSGGPPSPPP
jgi:hypothetical protein